MSHFYSAHISILFGENYMRLPALVGYLANQSTRNLLPQINMKLFFNNKNLLWNHHDMMCIHSAENLVKQKSTPGVIHFFMKMLCAF